jgi:hypothetical protein
MTKLTPEQARAAHPSRTGSPHASAERLGLSSAGYPHVDPTDPRSAYAAMTGTCAAMAGTFTPEILAHARLLAAEIIERARLIPSGVSVDARAEGLLRDVMRASELLAHQVMDGALGGAAPATTANLAASPEDLRRLIEDLIEGATAALVARAVEAFGRTVGDTEGAAP